MLRDMVTEKGKELVKNDGVISLGKAANKAAAKNIFRDYQERKAKNTTYRQERDLKLFAEFIASRKVKVGNLYNDQQAWRGVTWGLVAGFLRWMIAQGFAVGSVNVRLSTVKTYAKMAFKAAILPADEYALIKAVEGYSRKEAKRIDEQRDNAEIPTRIGDKKADPVILHRDQIIDLKEQPDTAQGRRDRLMFCILLDLGFRVSEVAQLKVSDIDLKNGLIRVYREKVDLHQTHELSTDALKAARAYLNDGDDPKRPLLRGSVKHGKLVGIMSTRAINKRVAFLGRKIGIPNLSPHDCRHSWATLAARSGTAINDLAHAGGWKGLSMPFRYIEGSRIANVGVKLSDDAA